MDDMPETLRKLISTSRIKRVPKGQILLYQGDELHEIFVLKSGVVKIHNIDDQGNEKILHLLRPTGVVPLAFFSGKNATTKWFYTALTDCEMHVASNETLQQVLRTDAATAVYLMNWFSLELHELLVRLDSLSKSNVKYKLAAALRFLASCHGVPQKNGWMRIPFPVSHQLIADMTGITRESAAMAMKQLADKKVIRNPQFAVLEINQEKLEDSSALNAVRV